MQKQARTTRNLAQNYKKNLKPLPPYFFFFHAAHSHKTDYIIVIYCKYYNTSINYVSILYCYRISLKYTQNLLLAR